MSNGGAICIAGKANPQQSFSDEKNGLSVQVAHDLRGNLQSGKDKRDLRFALPRCKSGGDSNCRSSLGLLTLGTGRFHGQVPELPVKLPAMEGPGIVEYERPDIDVDDDDDEKGSGGRRYRKTRRRESCLSGAEKMLR